MPSRREELRMGWRGSGERVGVRAENVGIGPSGGAVGVVVLHSLPKKENQPLGCSMSSSRDGSELLCRIGLPRWF